VDVCRSIGGYLTLTDFAKVLKDGCRFDNSYIGRCTAVLKMRTSLSSFTFLAVAFVLCRPAVSVAVYGQCGVCIIFRGCEERRSSKICVSRVSTTLGKPLVILDPSARRVTIVIRFFPFS